MQAVEQLAPTSGTAPTCAALGVARATLYRHRRRASAEPARAPIERSSHRALHVEERQAVLATLHSERFVDQSPAAVYARHEISSSSSAPLRRGSAVYCERPSQSFTVAPRSDGFATTFAFVATCAPFT